MNRLQLTVLVPVPRSDLESVIHAALASSGLIVHASEWCAGKRGIRCSLEGDAAIARAAVRTALPDGCDLCVRAHVPPRLFIADMDATMVREECLDELAAMAGAGARVQALTAAAMAGGMDFATALAERIAILAAAGVDRALIRRTLLERIHLQPGARTLVATLRATGVRCVLVSGGFEDFVAPVARELGFHHWRCNRFLFEDERLVSVTGPVIGREAKLETLRAEAFVGGLHASVAIGDGANDIPMLLGAGTGIAFHAKPAVDEAVQNRIPHGDLTSVLHFLGIPESAWVIPDGTDSLSAA